MEKKSPKKNNFFSENVKTLSWIFPAEALIHGAKQSNWIWKYNFCPCAHLLFSWLVLKLLCLFEKAKEDDIKN